MARVQFTPILQRHLDAPSVEVDGASVRAVLGAVFEANPRLRGYVLDDQGALRKHVAVFVDGAAADLDAQVGIGAEVFVMQALSGG